jgi:hypothetical protein
VTSTYRTERWGKCGIWNAWTLTTHTMDTNKGWVRRRFRVDHRFVSVLDAEGMLLVAEDESRTAVND